MTQPALKRQFAWSRGDRLYKARKDAGYKDAQAFGLRIGISRGTVANYEEDRTKPSKAAIKQWAFATGYRYEWLMDGTGEPFNADGPQLPHLDSNQEHSGYRRRIRPFGPRRYLRTHRTLHRQAA